MYSLPKLSQYYNKLIFTEACLMEDNVKGGKTGGFDIVDEAQKVIDAYIARYFSYPAKKRVKKLEGIDLNEHKLFTIAGVITVLLGLVAAALMILLILI